ncbi:MAG: hypothetical protein JNM88_10905 [Chitinophagaceae bacterium]|nr:hypothetical protein [Chitinophagaceae bacterium]
MKPLNEPVTSVPHFMPNQVLTDSQLNAVVDYLDQQERFTRQRLIGIGIICGFEINLQVLAGSNRAVQITSGVGISSCGFLFNLPEDIRCDRYRPITITDYDVFNRGTPGTPLNCIELIEDDALLSDEELEEVETLTSTQTGNKIVVLYLELKDKPNGTCLGENCDEKGNSWVFTLRKLLIAKNTMDLIIRYAHDLAPADSMDEFFNEKYYLPETFVERFGASAANANNNFTLSTIDTLTKFENEYIAVCRSAALRTARCIGEAYRLFKPMFDPQVDNAPAIVNGFSNTTQGTNTLVQRINTYLSSGQAKYKTGNTQYVYDYIRDLADSYNELREELFLYMAECSPPNDMFPRHLMLCELETKVIGRFTRNRYDLPTVYRHLFIPSPAMNDQSRHFYKVKQLMKRLLMLSDTNNYLSFTNLLTANLTSEPVRVIPGKTCAEPLGKRNIPFYYNPAQQPFVFEYWDYERTVTNMPYRNRGYYSSQYTFSAKPAFHPLVDRISQMKNSPVLFDLCKYPKLGIEGHVGKNLGDAIDKLKELRKQYNLSFDILALKLGTAQKTVAIADEKLIAEVQLMYLHERNDYVCCVQELEKYIREHKNSIGLGFYFVLYSLSDPNNPPSQTDVTNFLLLVSFIVDAYADALKAIAEAMPPDVKEFDFETMQQLYPVVSSFTNLFKYFINVWGDIELGLYMGKRGDGFNIQALAADYASILLNLWESYIDRIGDDCVLGKFATIWKAYQERVMTFSFFSEFNKQVHGMEHIAGTNYGGAFILVYEDFAQANNVQFFAKDESGKGVAGAEIFGSVTGKYYGKTDSSGRFSGMVAKEDDKIYVGKAAYVDTELNLKARKKEAVIKKYSSFTKKESWRQPQTANPVDAVHIKMSGAMGEMYKSYGQKYKLPQNLFQTAQPKAAASAALTVNNDLSTFRVVADFYLPHPVHNYNLEIEPFDACEELGEQKFIDGDALVSFMTTKLDVTSKQAFAKEQKKPDA